MTHVKEATEAGGVDVILTGAEYVSAAKNGERELAEARVAAKLAAKDQTLWGADAEHEASVRLGWLDLPSASRQYM